MKKWALMIIMGIAVSNFAFASQAEIEACKQLKEAANANHDQTAPALTIDCDTTHASAEQLNCLKDLVITKHMVLTDAEQACLSAGR